MCESISHLIIPSKHSIAFLAEMLQGRDNPNLFTKYLGKPEPECAVDSQKSSRCVKVVGMKDDMDSRFAEDYNNFSFLNLLV